MKKQLSQLENKLIRDFQFFSLFTRGSKKKNEDFEKQNAIYFNDPKEGAALKAAFEERKRLQPIYIKKLYENAEDLVEVEKQRREAENKFLIIYRRLVYKEALKRNEYYKDAKSHTKGISSFIGVMQDVLENHQGALIKILKLKVAAYKKQL